tara:strand:- start:1655 stop:2701 length:1047 start_codon:yes stop_codon:yes gene_type:complete
MNVINKQIVEQILYRYPNKISIKNLNIYNNGNSNNKILFNPDAKYYILKPKGKRAYLWFTYFEKKQICILIFMNNRQINHPSNEFYEYPIKFNDDICYNNMLLFGYYLTTNIHKGKQHRFVIENVFNYNIYNDILVKNDYNFNYNYKIELFKKILPQLYSNNNYVVNLPIILNNSDNVFKLINKLDYNIYSAAAYSDNKYLGNYIFSNTNNTGSNNNSNNNNKIVATFKITPCINQDLYNLTIMNNDTEEVYDLALIDSYKTSLFMNKLFRKIKENANLDLLEESDDEEEFENVNVDKFVHLNKQYLIDCVYNHKFKKWVPQNISKNKVITKHNLESILGKKKYNHIL